MRIGVFVYARSDSRRLPGKLLSKFGETSLLGHVLKRAMNVEATDWLVLTSNRPVDNEIDFQARSLGFDVCRGSANDLVARTLEGLDVCPVKHFIRVNADSPWFDATLVNDALGGLTVPMTSNLVTRRFPYGVSVEIVESDFYKKKASFSREHELEHVTQHIYRTRKVGELRSLVQDRDDSHLRLTVDTQDDYQNMSAIFSQPNVDFQASYWNVLNLPKPVLSYDLI
jgi:spore coat polysaccharide biosynthesis protein SpsF (cytidylyltransferase family)